MVRMDDVDGRERHSGEDDRVIIWAERKEENVRPTPMSGVTSSSCVHFFYPKTAEMREIRPTQEGSMIC